MIDLTDLQEDILTLAVENPDMTNEEIAEILDCSEEWVGEVRRKYEHKVNENKVDKDLNTRRGTANTVSANSGGALDTLVITPIILSLELTFWVLENSLKLTFWLVEKTLEVSFWLLELPFRILDALAGSKKN